MVDNSFLTNSFKREPIEHAHTSVRRLQEYLRTLATISALNSGADRGTLMVREATALLKVVGCVLQTAPGIEGKERFFVHRQAGVESGQVTTLAASLNTRVSNGSITIENLLQRFPQQSWLLEHDIQSYMAVPVFGSDQSISAVAGVFGGRQSSLSEEDDWWLRIAAQMVSDSLHSETLEGKLRAGVGGIATDFVNESMAEDKLEVPKPCVLVIDDEHQINNLICELLEDEGYQVDAAFNGVEAIQTFQPARHTLVITDVAMPLMNGWELIAALRVRAPSLPIILITGYHVGEWNQKFLTQQGVSGVLSKPLNLDELTSLVARLLPMGIAQRS